MIDLHLHTTASDGLDAPEALVEQLDRSGIRIFAVTDHDTVAALPEVAAAARSRGLQWIPGIEITAVEDDRDVHVLAYGFDIRSTSLGDFLVDQRASRVDRLTAFGARFAALGMPIDVGPLIGIAQAGKGRSVGRAHVARALVAAGYVSSVDQVFNEWLSPGRPGFVPRRGASVQDVVGCVRAAGGIASLAHPGLIRDDNEVTRLLRGTFDAVEAYHSEHDSEATARYRGVGAALGLALTGGSDFHGEAASRRRRLGGVSLPLADYEALRRRAASCAHPWPES